MRAAKKGRKEETVQRPEKWGAGYGVVIETVGGCSVEEIDDVPHDG